MADKPVCEIDGNDFNTLEKFFIAFSHLFDLDPNRGGFDRQKDRGPLSWGHNLDAFNDILRWRLGESSSGYVLKWKNYNISKEKLGEDFDHLVDIIKTHGPSGREASDNVDLVLEYQTQWR